MRPVALLLAALLFADSLHAAPPAAAVTMTAKSLDAFAQCFVSSQQRASRAWWFVPSEDGGTFSDLGAKDAAGAYFVKVRVSGTRTVIELDTSNQETRALVTRAIQSCV